MKLSLTSELFQYASAPNTSPEARTCSTLLSPAFLTGHTSEWSFWVLAHRWETEIRPQKSHSPLPPTWPHLLFDLTGWVLTRTPSPSKSTQAVRHSSRIFVALIQSRRAEILLSPSSDFFTLSSLSWDKSFQSFTIHHDTRLSVFQLCFFPAAEPK